jgi:hypothetical protein
MVPNHFARRFIPLPKLSFALFHPEDVGMKLASFLLAEFNRLTRRIRSAASQISR